MEARKDDSNELEMTRMDDSTADAGLAVEPAPEEMDRRPRVPRPGRATAGGAARTATQAGIDGLGR